LCTKLEMKKREKIATEMIKIIDISNSQHNCELFFDSATEQSGGIIWNAFLPVENPLELHSWKTVLDWLRVSHMNSVNLEPFHNRFLNLLGIFSEAKAWCDFGQLKAILGRFQHFLKVCEWFQGEARWNNGLLVKDFSHCLLEITRLLINYIKSSAELKSIVHLQKIENLFQYS